MMDLKDEKFEKFGDYLKLKRKELNVSQQKQRKLRSLPFLLILTRRKRKGGTKN